jgi:hypothetical protein
VFGNGSVASRKLAPSGLNFALCKFDIAGCVREREFVNGSCPRGDAMEQIEGAGSTQPVQDGIHARGLFRVARAWVVIFNERIESDSGVRHG